MFWGDFSQQLPLIIHYPTVYAQNGPEAIGPCLPQVFFFWFCLSCEYLLGVVYIFPLPSDRRSDVKPWQSTGMTARRRETRNIRKPIVVLYCRLALSCFFFVAYKPYTETESNCDYASKTNMNVCTPEESHFSHIHASSIRHSNGRPLKSSLKLSSTPSYSFQLSRSIPIAPKNVHFPETNLESFCIFSRSAKPSSISNANSNNGTETENEPFRSCGLSFSNFSSPPSTHNTLYDIDPTNTTPIPCHNTQTHANIRLESLGLSCYFPTTPTTITITGTILVRNLTYEKHVAIRFTLDDWLTTNEVFARHLVSLHFLPPQLIIMQNNVNMTDHHDKQDSSPSWDRFTFTIPLHLHNPSLNLHQRVLYLAALFAAGGGEWWDNNGGRNYRVGFRQSKSTSGLVDKNISQITGNGTRCPTPHPSQLALLTNHPPAPVSNRTPLSIPTHPKTHHPSPMSAAQALAITEWLKKHHLKNYAAPSSVRTKGSTNTGNFTTPTAATTQAEMDAPMNMKITGGSENMNPDWNAPDAANDMFVGQCRYKQQAPVSLVGGVVVG